MYFSKSWCFSHSNSMATIRLLRHSIFCSHHRPPINIAINRGGSAGFHMTADNHDFSKPCGFLGSWDDPPSDPKEAEARLDRLRKHYRKQMKQVRREYSYEVEMLRIEKQRKDDARREADRIANKEMKAAKAAMARTRAEERKAFREQFRLTLSKERAEKLESWRVKEDLREKKKNEREELLCQQSSIWIAEDDLENRVLAAFVDTTPL